MDHSKRVMIFFLVISFIMVATACQSSTSETSTGKITLTLGCYGEKALPAVSAFNLAQDDYEIELVDYSQEGARTHSSALQRLAAELASGEGPDILYLWNLQMNASTYGQKGYLEDLYPYLDADAELSRDSIVSSFFNAYETDGKLYGAASGFSVITMLGSKSELDAFPEWNFSAMVQLAEAHGGIGNFLSTSFSPAGFLESALMVSYSDYIDLNSGTAFFDTDAYKQLLSFCSNLQNSSVSENPGLTFYTLSSFQELQYYEALYNDELSIIGYPTENGSGHCFVNLCDQFAINSNSEHKDAAWEFIRLIFSESYQIENYVDSGFPQFPTNQGAMNALIQSETTAEYTTDENGQTQEIPKRGTQSDFVYYAASQSDVDQIMAMINDTDTVYATPSPLLDIALEEAEDLWNGQKNVDNVSSITQNRAQVYLDEGTWR